MKRILFITVCWEYPQYTRPASYDGNDVPEVLMSGHHENIRKWRKYQAIKKTYLRRPDLLEDYKFDQESIEMLKKIKENDCNLK